MTNAGKNSKTVAKRVKTKQFSVVQLEGWSVSEKICGDRGLRSGVFSASQRKSLTFSHMNLTMPVENT